MSFPFPDKVPAALGTMTAKPMQWPNGAQVEEDDWEFFPEAMKSWRAWRVINRSVDSEPDQITDGVLMLQSITYRTIWTPKQEMIAECTPMRSTAEGGSQKSHTHPCPDLKHGCGIYSVKTEKQALEWKKYRVHDPVVWGRVNIWGHVYKFTKGYLSEFAYPSQIYVPDDLGSWNYRITPEMLALELTQTYGVEAVTT